MSEASELSDWLYGFRADGGNVFTHCFGVPFSDAESAHHAGVKSYSYELEILRRRANGDWEEVPNYER